MWQKRFGVRFSRRILLTVLVLGLVTPFAGAQGGGGGGGGGGIGGLGGGASSGGGLNSTNGGGGGAAGSLTGSIGVSTPIGSGNISAFKGGNSTGLSSLTSTTTTASSTTIPVTSDPFNPFYVNPYSAGLIGNTTTPAFGQPNYPPGTAPTATTIQTYKAVAPSSFNTLGVRRSPAFITTTGKNVPMIHHNPAKLQSELQGVLARSSVLKSKNSIHVEVLAGAVARLTGLVEDEDEMRLAEAIIRTMPGVQNVVNSLQVAQVAQAQASR